MARTVTHCAESPEQVWEVLADAQSYADWVVGTEAIRDADATWPAPGSKLHHRVGWGPLKLNDHTEVLESAPPNRLVLQANARPLGSARVTMEVVPEGRGARVTMLEGPGDAISRLLHNPLFDALVARRNVESLRRLVSLASRAAGARTTTGPSAGSRRSARSRA
jgi:uncharacterized protein YndB with AHSA1/START domain